MNDLGEDARELIERALRDEPSVDAAELQRIRRQVLAAGAGASIFGSVGKAVAMLGKASLGPAIKAFSVGVAVTVLALGIPTVLSSDKSPARGVPHVPSAVAPKLVERSAAAHNAAPQLPTQAPRAASSPPSPRAVVAAAPSRAILEPAPRAVVAAAPSPATPGPETTAASPASPPSASVTSSATRMGLDEAYSTPSLAGLPRRSPLVQEITLLEKVQSELRAGRGQAALQLLDASVAPVGGQLEAERLAAEVFAACQAGEVARARAAAGRFESKFAHSPASARVRGSCAGERDEHAR